MNKTRELVSRIIWDAADLSLGTQPAQRVVLSSPSQLGKADVMAGKYPIRSFHAA